MAVTYSLGTLDVVIVAGMFVLSAAIGLYYAWQSRKSKDTRDFLVAHKLGMLPLVASSLATYINPINILGLPTEVYLNGLQMSIFLLSGLAAQLVDVFALLPVFFRLNLSTVNQYIEYRFNRVLKVCQAILVVVQTSLNAAALVHITVLVMSDSTKISYWWSMAIICGVCGIYSSMGGFMAVIWTDCMQLVIILVTILILVIKGTINLGGVANIWKLNADRNRTDTFYFSPSNPTNYSFWSATIGGFFVFLSFSAFQPIVQRQNASKTLKQAKTAGAVTKIGSAVTNIVIVWIGMMNFARYHDCDPVKNGELQSPDQITVLYALEVFSQTSGLVGLFLAGLLASSLSTMSSFLNSFSTVIIVDFVKPLFPNIKDGTLVFLSKLSGLVYGAMVVAFTLVVNQFNGIVQIILVISGICYGPVSGVFLLGFLFPWANATGAWAGFLCALVLISWAAIGQLYHGVPYYTLPLTTEGCNATINQTFADVLGLNYSSDVLVDMIETEFPTSLIATVSNSTTESISSVQSITEDIFGLYLINTMWYAMIAIFTVIIVGMVVSLATGTRDPELVSTSLISPLTWYLLSKLPVSSRKWLGFRSKKFHGKMRLEDILEESDKFLNGAELSEMKPNLNSSDKFDNPKSSLNDGQVEQSELKSLENSQFLAKQN